MPAYVTNSFMRQIDKFTIEKIGIPGVVLMENAGRSVSEQSIKFLSAKRKANVIIFCGGGNNGGDGFVTARHLVNSGIKLTIVLTKPYNAYTGDALINLNIIRKMNIPIVKKTKNLRGYDLIIDALLGTGAKGEIREPYKNIIEQINDSNKPVISVDIPSGLNGDTGDACGAAVKANITVTMGCPKKGMLKRKARKYVGKLAVADIGFPKENIKKHFRRLFSYKTSPK